MHAARARDTRPTFTHHPPSPSPPPPRHPSFTALLQSDEAHALTVSPTGPPPCVAGPPVPPAPDGGGGEYPGDPPPAACAVDYASSSSDDEGRGKRPAAATAPSAPPSADRSARVPARRSSPGARAAAAAAAAAQAAAEDTAAAAEFDEVDDTQGFGVGGRPLPRGFVREDILLPDRPTPARVLFARCVHGKHKINAMAPALRFLAGKHGRCRPEWAALCQRAGEDPARHRERVRQALGFGKPRGIAVIRQQWEERGLEPPPIGVPRRADGTWEPGSKRARGTTPPSGGRTSGRRSTSRATTPSAAGGSGWGE